MSEERPRGRQLGRVLIKMGKLRRAQVHEALEIQKEQRGPVGAILVDRRSRPSLMQKKTGRRRAFHPIPPVNWSGTGGHSGMRKPSVRKPLSWPRDGRGAVADYEGDFPSAVACFGCFA